MRQHRGKGRGQHQETQRRTDKGTQSRQTCLDCLEPRSWRTDQQNNETVAEGAECGQTDCEQTERAFRELGRKQSDSTQPDATEGEPPAEPERRVSRARTKLRAQTGRFSRKQWRVRRGRNYQSFRERRTDTAVRTRNARRSAERGDLCRTGERRTVVGAVLGHAGFGRRTRQRARPHRLPAGNGRRDCRRRLPRTQQNREPVGQPKNQTRRALAVVCFVGVVCTEHNQTAQTQIVKLKLVELFQCVLAKTVCVDRKVANFGERLFEMTL